MSSYYGLHPDTVDTSEVAALLIDTGIFEEICVSYSQGPDGVIVEIGLREKWSLIPLPSFVAGSDGIVAGAAHHLARRLRSAEPGRPVFGIGVKAQPGLHGRALDLSVAYNAATGIPRLSFGVGMRM